MSPPNRRRLLGIASLLIAAAIWLPTMHLCYVELSLTPALISPRGRALAERHIRLWTNPALRDAEIARMRGTNAEWDFMGRSFLAWSLANIAIRDPEQKPRCLEVIDRIIDETMRLEEDKGHEHFLLPYARQSPFRVQPNRSLFVDGEIALMLAARRLVEEKPEYQAPLLRRVDRLLERMRAGPVLSGESYPNECWTFCNTVALAAIRAADALDGTDHREFLRRWVSVARAKLTDPTTGLLVSSFTHDGTHLDGPEGSTIWLAAHCLAVVDPAYARDQYERARRELGCVILGFGFAREWPASWVGDMDVDSGPVVPLIEASPSSSGLAFVGASTFDDRAFLDRLRTTIEFAGFPRRSNGGLEYCASNQVGDAVVLYGEVQGPLWAKILAAGAR